MATVLSDAIFCSWIQSSFSQQYDVPKETVGFGQNMTHVHMLRLPRRCIMMALLGLEYVTAVNARMIWMLSHEWHKQTLHSDIIVALRAIWGRKVASDQIWYALEVAL